ncbi:type I polyketide synthase [Streptomyces sp. NPDC050448]|uniref:type I polyketide synthase n=1 Tax=Streptomyces sp. NPDC050448 TaxID=3155404 RepID=UPI003437939F
MTPVREELLRPLVTSLSGHRPDRPAFTDDRRTVTYGELLASSGALATGLGVARGDRVLIHVGSRVEFAEYCLAVLRSAAVGVPVSVRSPEAELAYCADDSGATLLITEARHAAMAQRLRERRPQLRVLIVEDPPAPGPGSPADDLGMDEPAWLLYTSGTTGPQKGVLTTQRAMLWSAAACYVPMLGLSEHDTVVWPLPLHHCFALSLAFAGTMAIGAHTRIADGDLPALLAEHPGCVLAGVPATYLQLTHETRGVAVAPRLSVSAGAPCGAATRAAVMDLFGTPLLDCYGATETSGKIAVQLPGESGLTPVHGVEIRIADGEILVRTPGLMLGYHGQPGPFVDDGWYRTGDAGRIDDGRLTIAGRIDDVIICGGQNVHPLEIEAVIAESPSVRDVLVAGRKDDLVGEVPVAFVVPADPDGFVSISPGELRRLCLGRLSLFKVPVEFRPVESIPHTSSGKPMRRAMAEQTAGPRELGSPAALAELVREEIAVLCGEDLGDARWRERAFTELGLSSLAAVQLRHRIAALTGIDLPHSLVYDFPTPGELIGELARLVAAEPVPEPIIVRPPASDEPIAIVAMSCRYPGGVRSPEDLWQLVRDGVDATGDFPDDRGWDLAGLYDPDPDRIGTSTTQRGGFLYDAAEFDAGMFRVSPREALATDPQQRLLLETSWELFERAGIDATTLRGSGTGVFIGVMNEDYASRFEAHELEGRLGIGSSHAVASGRISYTFGLTGPAVTVDTACSSSLVALHWAARSLRTGECSLAVAGGATVMSTPRTFLAFSRQRGLSPDGRCRSYAADADGTAWSEGAGLVLLERLSDARRNGHPVLAVLRGSATNADGASNGLTAPSARAQREVIGSALADAGLSAADVDAVDGHGTATPLGDPIEAEALLATYGQGRDHRPLWLGSVKSNLGHTQAAAGMAGVIKMVEAMRHGQLPASLHADNPSPRIDWSAGRVSLLATAQPWPAGGRTRRAAVSSFGIGGTNAHVIIEEAPAEDPVAVARPGFPAAPWLLSAADGNALRAVATALLDAPDDIGVGYTLAVGRTALAHRAMVAAGDRAALRALASGEGGGTAVRAGARIAFLFSGQGAQRAGMGRDLAQRFPVFAEAFDEACRALGGEVREIAFSTGPDRLLDRTDHAQAALFAFEVALHRLLESWGVRPDVLVGHSAGEIAAAHVAGVLSLEDAATLVGARGRLMAELPADGVMFAVEATEAEVAPLVAEVADRVSIAAVNGTHAVVVSGEEAATTALAGRFRRSTRLRVSHAFHSPLLEPMLDKFREVAETLTYHRPGTPVVSGLTGGLSDSDAMCSAAYWVRHARHTVRFADALSTLVETGVTICLEVGPDAVLSRAAAAVLPAVPATRAGHDEGEALLTALGSLHTAGIPVAWRSVFAGSGARPVPLPTYPFQRTRYWLDPPQPGRQGQPGVGGFDHALLGPALVAPDSPRIVHGGSIGVRAHSWLADHVVGDAVVVPATAFVDIALHAGTAGLDELTIEAPLRLTPGKEVQLQVVVDGQRIDVYAKQRAAGPWTRHASGRLRPCGPAPEPYAAEWPPAGAERLDVDGRYDALAFALAYGPAFRAVTALWRRGDELFAEIDLPEGVAGRFGLHPVLLDAAVHAAALAEGPAGGARVPFVWGGVELYAPGVRSARIRCVRTGSDTVAVDVFDHAGAPVAAVASMFTRPMAPQESMLFRPRWIPVPAAPATADTTVLEILNGWGDDVRSLTTRALEALHHWQDHGAGRLVVLTRNGTAPDPELAAAAVGGLVSAAAAEHPERITLVDLVGDARLPADRVLDLVGGSLEPQLAVRDGVPHALRITRAAPSDARPLDPAGTVLITGGTGSLGALLARHLVREHGIAHLVLVSRRGPAAPDAERLRAELSELGADVRIVAADVADRAVVERLIAACDPPLTAVVHTAAVVDDGVLAAQTPARMDTVLKPKADAAWVLHEATRELPLSAFVLYSSVAGVFGKAGQANYGAANRFLDALACHRRALGLPAVSLAWGLWEPGSGLGEQISGLARRRMRESGIAGLSAEQGLALFDAALGSAEPVLVPVLLDPAATAPPPIVGGLVRKHLPPAPARRSWPARMTKPELRDLLRAELAAVLGLGEPDQAAFPDDRPFTDLGFDSLAVIQVRTRLNRLTGLDLPARMLFEKPTTGELADHLYAELFGRDSEGDGDGDGDG